jgi:hypothetical protein
MTSENSPSNVAAADQPFPERTYGDVISVRIPERYATLVSTQLIRNPLVLRGDDRFAQEQLRAIG